MALFARDFLLMSQLLPTITSFTTIATQSKLGMFQGQVSLERSLGYLSGAVVRRGEELALFDTIGGVCITQKPGGA